METMNNVLYFLNKLDFVGYLESKDHENFNCNKKVLTDEFQDINSEKLINMLGVVDDLRILFLTQSFQDNQRLTTDLRDDIYLLFEEKTGN